MKLKVLGSSSAGNCYVLENDQEALILDCGIRFSKVKEALGFNLSKVVGALLTHQHGDHAGFVRDFLRAGITVHSGKDTIEATGITSHRWSPVEEAKSYYLRSWQVMPFDVKHDVPCLGYLLRHPDCGTVCFITDSYYVPYTFSNLNNVIIEANYCEEILGKNFSDGRVHGKVRDHILAGHMEFKTTKEFLRANDLSQVNNIVLIHLSDSNSNTERFQREVSELTGKKVTIAHKGLTIDFNKTPF